MTTEVTTADKVKYIKDTFPGFTCTRIAKELGVSRERVRQILKKLDYPTVVSSKIYLSTCKICPNTILTRSGQKAKSFCSPECRDDAYVIKGLECFYCHTIFSLKRSKYNAHIKKGYKNLFCSHPCIMKYNIRVMGVGFQKGQESLMKKKDFCIRGHDLNNLDNLYVHSKGRQCKLCRRIRESQKSTIKNKVIK
jgi:hypothetical protein